MKLRQKLAVLLAASMAFTAVPVVTMAKSDFSLTKGIQIAEDEKPASNKLKVEMEDATGNFMFFVSIKNAEFTSDQTNAPLAITGVTGVTATYSYKNEGKEMSVNVNVADGGTTDFDLYLPLDVKLKGGDATVSVDGNGSSASDMSAVIFARTSDTKAKITVDDAEAIYAEAKQVAEITIEEPFKGVLMRDAKSSVAKEIKFTIRHSDYKFISEAIVDGTVVQVKGEKGFNGITGADLGTLKIDSKDSGIMVFTPNYAKLNAATAPGRLVFAFELDTTEKAPTTGNLDIKVSGDNVDDATVKVGEVKDYGTIIEMDDKKVVDITAGQSEEITFTIKEAVANTFSGDREFDITLDKGFLFTKQDGEKYDNVEFDADKAVADLESKLDGLKVISAITDDDDYVTGLTVKIPTAELKTDDEAEFEIEDLEVFVPLGTSGDITVKASGRALGDDASVVAVNAKSAVTVTAKPMTVKVGLKEQAGGEIVIKEADKGIIKQGEKLYIKIDDSDTTLKLKDTDIEDKIEVTSGDLVLDLDSADVDGGVLTIKVKRESTEASTITVKDLTVYADRTVPQGTFDVKIGGKALSEDWTIGDKNETDTDKDFKVEDFIIVGTPNTEDITANGLKKGTSSFVIGSSKYIVNGVEAEMDGTVYSVDGRTMVPVRFVANALGVDAKDIYFASGTVTVIAGSKTVSLTIGNKVAKLNGVPVRTMTAAPVVKDGRVYVPVAEIGSLLGVTATWDSATQTATFTN